jgi:hypothetical protein
VPTLPAADGEGDLIERERHPLEPLRGVDELRGQQMAARRAA